MTAGLCLSGCGPAPKSRPQVSPRKDVTQAAVQVTRRSPSPDPKRSDYADCLYTAEVKVLEIRSGPRVPREIVLDLPCFSKRSLGPEASFQAGQIIEVEIIPHEMADEQHKAMQRSDTLDRFDLPVHDALRAQASSRSLASFPTQADSYFASASGAKPTPTTPMASAVRYPWSSKAAAERQAALAIGKESILKALQDNGGDWNAWAEKIQPFYEDLCHQGDQAPHRELFKGNFEYTELIRGNYKKLCNAGDAGSPGPLMMLSSLNKQLRARGIDLIVVPFPTKEDVSAEQFSPLAPKDGWFEPYRQKFLLQLLEADIEVIDLVQPLRAARSRFPYVFYNDDDEHPADGAIQVAAEEITKRLQRYELKGKDGKRLDLHLKPVEVQKPTNRGLLKFPATQVAMADEKPLVVPESSGSPVIIMGDSYTRIPHRYLEGGDGCAIPMHLAYHLGVMPDNLIRMGSSDQAMRLLAREGGDYLGHRCAVVFVFAYTRLFGTVASNKEHKEDTWDMVSLPPLKLDQK